MKQVKLILIVFIMIFFVTGCNGNITRDIRKDGFILSNSKIVCKDLIPEKEKYPASKKISYMSNGFAVTTDGEIYEFSIGQKYSNNENCRIANTSLRVVSMFDNNVFKASDGKFYYTVENSNTAAYSEVTINDNSYQIYKLVLSDPKVRKVITVDQNAGSYYVLLDDGNIYNYVITRGNYNSPFSISSKDIVYDANNYEGKIIDFNYSDTEKSKTYIKTVNEIYRMQITNSSKCNKYADVKCKYKMKKDEVLTKYYLNNKIVYYGSNILITSYGRVFN